MTLNININNTKDCTCNADKFEITKNFSADRDNMIDVYIRYSQDEQVESKLLEIFQFVNNAKPISSFILTLDETEVVNFDYIESVNWSIQTQVSFSPIQLLSITGRLKPNV